MAIFSSTLRYFHTAHFVNAKPEKKRKRGQCLCFRAYLLDVLLEHAQLQPLVQPHLSMLPDVLEAPLMVEDLMHDIQDAVNLQNSSDVAAMSTGNVSLFPQRRVGTDRFGVIGGSCQRISVARAQRPLEDVQQSFAILAHLKRQTGLVSKLL